MSRRAIGIELGREFSSISVAALASLDSMAKESERMDESLVIDSHVFIWSPINDFNFSSRCLFRSFFICRTSYHWAGVEESEKKLTHEILPQFPTAPLRPPIHITTLDHFSLNTAEKVLNNIKSAIKVIFFTIARVPGLTQWKERISSRSPKSVKIKGKHLSMLFMASHR